MAKVKAATTLSPAVFGLGNGVLVDGVRAVVEQQNYSAGEHVQRAGYCGLREPIGFTGSVILQGWIWVPTWAATVGYRLTTSGGGTYAPTITVGGATTASLTANTTVTGTLNVSTTGSGLQVWTVQGTYTSGSAQLDNVVLEVGPVAASHLPDPTG